jgi:hypothetical protein
MIMNEFEDETPVIFVNERIYDENSNSQMMTTEVIEYRNNSFVNKACEKEDQKAGKKGFDKSDFALRDERIELCDVDGDGWWEVPMEVRSNDQSNEGNLNKVEWISLRGDEPELKTVTLETLAMSYSLTLPKEW